MKAKELMTPNPQVCTSDDRICDAARLMRDFDVGSLPVVENSGTNRLIGIITDRDLVVGPVADERFTATVADAMTPNPKTVRTDADVSEVERIMAENQVRRIPVVGENGELAGIITMADVALEMEDQVEIAETLEDISSGSGFWSKK